MWPKIFKSKEEPKKVLKDYSGASTRRIPRETSANLMQPYADNVPLLRTMYSNSWAAKKIIDVPIDDMMLTPRIIGGQDITVEDKDKISNFYSELKLDKKIRSACKLARLVGSAYILLISTDGEQSKPLSDKGMVKLKSLIVVDRTNITSIKKDSDITSTNFGKPLQYNINLGSAVTLDFHHTRVIQVDGEPQLSDVNYDHLCFGNSVLAPMISVINAEANRVGIVDSILQEVSLTIIKSDGLKAAMLGDMDGAGVMPGDNINPLDAIMGSLRDHKTVDGVYLIDKDDMEISRLEANLSGFPKLLEMGIKRIASSCNIPATRLLGSSPDGLNSTGDSDLKNYAAMIESLKVRLLDPIYQQIDKIAMRTLGINGVLTSTYTPLLDISSQDKAAIQLNNSKRDAAYITAGVLSEEEVREKLHEDGTFPNIDPELLPHSVDDDLKEEIISNNSSIDDEDEEKA